MDRPTTFGAECSTAVRTAGDPAIHVLLRATGGERREPGAAPETRRVVSRTSILRQPAHGGPAGRESQARSAADADCRDRSNLSQTEPEPAGAGSRDLSVPAARCLDRAAQPRLEHRYYVHSDAWRIPVSG